MVTSNRSSTSLQLLLLISLAWRSNKLRTLDADVTIGCYYGDYSSCDNTIPTSLLILEQLFSLALVIISEKIPVTKPYVGGDDI